MLRTRNRVTFRMSDTQFARFKSLLGQSTGVRTWTDLVLKALTELWELHERRNHPLHAVPYDQEPVDINNFLQDRQERLAAELTRNKKTVPNKRPADGRGRVPRQKTIRKKGKKKHLPKINHKR